METARFFEERLHLVQESDAIRRLASRCDISQRLEECSARSSRVEKHRVPMRPNPVVFDVVDDELADAPHRGVKRCAVGPAGVVDCLAFGALSTVRVRGDRGVVDPHLRRHDECATERVLVLQVRGDERQEAVDIAVRNIERNGDEHASECFYHRLDTIIRWAADAGS